MAAAQLCLIRNLIYGEINFLNTGWQKFREPFTYHAMW